MSLDTTELLHEVEEKTQESNILPKLTNIQLLNFCIGFLGLQFAWSMQIALSGRVLEPLGATPIIIGLIWLAGPISGMLVQPIVGALSDNLKSKFGRRRPFLVIGAVLTAIALVAFPKSAELGAFIPGISGLIMATILMWVMDSCINMTQGPYRALVPDIAPKEQHALANSFLSLAIGIGAVISFGTAPALKAIFGIQMSIMQQFIMAAIAFIIGIVWTCATTPEKQIKVEIEPENKESSMEPVKNFLISVAIALVPTVLLAVTGIISLSSGQAAERFSAVFALFLSVPLLTIALKSFSSKEVYKLCAVQFFTWLGIMAMFIFFGQYVIHNIFQIPDLSSVSESVRLGFKLQLDNASNMTGVAFAIYNAVCLFASMPISYLSSKFGKKNVHSVCLAFLAFAFLGLAFWAKAPWQIYTCLGFAGIGWASVLSLPFALLTEHIVKGTEGSAMGKLNLFIAGPQILTSVVVGYLIQSSKLTVPTGITNHYEYAFIIGGISVLIAAIITLFVKEKSSIA